MQSYIGTKRVNATPMTRITYNNLRGWTLPEDENGDDAGFLVEYVDGGKANVLGYDGYVSWSPANVFERAYKPTSGMSFGDAIAVLKAGGKVAREGWNGKGMFVYLVPGSQFQVSRAPLLGIYPEGTQIDYRPHIDIKNVDGSIATWAPSIGDTLADDWAEVV